MGSIVVVTISHRVNWGVKINVGLSGLEFKLAFNAILGWTRPKVGSLSWKEKYGIEQRIVDNEALCKEDKFDTEQNWAVVMGRCNGQVVSVLTFYSDGPSSNPDV